MPLCAPGAVAVNRHKRAEGCVSLGPRDVVYVVSMIFIVAVVDARFVFQEGGRHTRRRGDRRGCQQERRPPQQTDQ